MFRALTSRLQPSWNFVPFSIFRLKTTTSNADSLRNDQHKKLCRNEMTTIFDLGGYSPDPATITDEQWKYICSLPSKNQRRNHFKDLFMKQVIHSKKHQENFLRTELRQEKRRQVLKMRNDGHIEYGLGKNSLFLRFGPDTLRKWKNLKLMHSKLHRQKLIVDCTFEYHMNDREISKVASNLEQVYTANRDHVRPFDLHLFTSESSSQAIEKFCKQISSRQTEIHNECYTKRFPKERLVLLTADSDVDLTYDRNDIYVIGGIMDKGHSTPVMLAKAKSLGLRTARLPLHRYGFRQRNDLPFRIVANILRELQNTRDWRKILDEYGPEIPKENEYRFRYATKDL